MVYLSLMLILLLPLVSSVEVSMNKEFKSSETLQAKISGNFLTSVTNENIEFYRGHVKIPIEFDIAKINEEYYLYALLPEVTEKINYSLTIKDTEYYNGTSIKSDDINIPFTILQDLADFTVTPGFVVDNKDFSLKVQNLKPNKITIQVNAVNSGIVPEFSSLELKSGEIKNIKFFVSNSNTSELNEISLTSSGTSYKIITSIIGDFPGMNSNFSSFTLSPKGINASFVKGSEKTKSIKLINNGNNTINNISLSISDSLLGYVFLTEYSVDDLAPNETENIDLLIRSDKTQYLEGRITATSENLQLVSYLDISLEVVPDFESLPPSTVIPDSLEDYNSSNDKLTCKEVGGTFCGSGEVCKDNDIEYLFAGDCCKSECTSAPTSSRGKIIGWTIVGIVIVILLWFFIKYKRAKRF